MTPTYALVSGRLPLHVGQALEAALQYSRSVYGYIPAERRRGWRTVVHSLLFKTPEGALVFPAGLLHRVASHLTAAVVTIEPLAEPASLPPMVRNFANGESLYPDQVAAVEITLSRRRGLLALATNFGKTEVVASVLATLPHCAGLVIVDQRSLVGQLTTHLEQLLGEPVSALGAGRVRGRVVVSTIQTLHARRLRPAMMDYLAGVELLLVDEAHRISPPSWYPTLEACTGAWLRIGLSGTLAEVSALPVVEAFFGPILHTVQDAALISAGRSAATTVLMPWVGHLIQDERDYEAKYTRGVVSNYPRNQLLATFAAQAAMAGLPTVISFYRLDHGDVLERLCRERYLGPVARLDGSSQPHEVAAVTARAARGDPGIYVVGVGYNQGHDLPGIRVLINAAAWKSPLATSQRAGRVLRRKGVGGNWAVIVDPYDLGNATLKRHAQARGRTYRRKGLAVEEGAPEALLDRLRVLGSPMGVAPATTCAAPTQT